MKKILSATVVICLIFASCKNSKDGNAEMDRFIDDLMSKMTLEEKIGQLNLPTIGFDITGPVLSKDVEQKIEEGLTGGVFNTFTPQAMLKLQEIAITKTRLKIPLLFGYDVIHGHKTIFPIPLGLSASWDTALIRSTARAAALEASADGLNWVFSPMVDIARDPRWGRVSEGAGEDAFLGSAVARAMVEGYQDGCLRKNTSVMACVKHFALYGAAEAGRDYNTVDMSEVKMYNEYLPPYKAAIDAGVGSLMASFNTVNGIPATCNTRLLTDLLRRQWNFKGVVVSDYTAIAELENHGLGNRQEVSALSINAGTDMDMVSEYYLTQLPALVREGKVKESVIDIACRRILEAKYKLGLFDDPYRGVSQERADKEIMSADKLALSKEAAIKSMVLLKNNGVLPLSKDKKILFTGPLADDHRNLIGNWSGAGDSKKSVSLWEALLKERTYMYAKGCNLTDDKTLIDKLNPHDGQIVPDDKTPQELLQEAVKMARSADVVVAVLGEPFGMGGEAASRSNIGLLENQKTLLAELKKTGKPIVLVLMNSRPLTLEWEDKNMDAILETWYSGTMAGEAIKDVLFGNAEPEGRLTITFPRNTGQIPIYYSYLNTGRPDDENQKYTSKYLDCPNTPLYPFGYGLSYTQFEISPVTLSDTTLAENGSLEATVTLTNKGTRRGTETVQLYIRDLTGSISRPVKELKGFEKVTLEPNESRQITFTVTPEILKFYNASLQYTVEQGDFNIYIGNSSATENKTAFTYKP
ncbi:MAG: beta-glucosidase BglX [Bacteroidales bacterium]|jgi:beta-glucosidase|nr:beta-glucosidase BglX [Bacteroidales bacterium]